MEKLMSKENVMEFEAMTQLHRAMSRTFCLLVIGFLISCNSLVEAGSTPTARDSRSAVPSGGVLLDVDFEDAAVRPHPKKKLKNKMDVLEIKLPSGQPVEAPIFYQGGDPSGRYARVIPDPTKSGNHVLHYWMKNAQVPGERKGRHKGRIQMAMSDVGLTEAYQRYRMYLHPDLKLYRSYPGENAWFTINELWFGARWKGHPHPLRITLGIVKEKGVGKSLRFLATGDIGEGGPRSGDKWKTIWHSMNNEFEVPVGEWMDMEVGYKQGDKKTGRFYVAIKRESDAAMTTVIDVNDWTYHPGAKAPVPMTDWNPLKLYTSSSIIDFIRNNGGVTQIYYDDLLILRNWPN
jgi:hypothetical protein